MGSEVESIQSFAVARAPECIGKWQRSSLNLVAIDWQRSLTSGWHINNNNNNNIALSFNGRTEQIRGWRVPPRLSLAEADMPLSVRIQASAWVVCLHYGRLVLPSPRCSSLSQWRVFIMAIGDKWLNHQIVAVVCCRSIGEVIIMQSDHFNTNRWIR